MSNVSDTARWVAVHRSTESGRADALFRDPLAEVLAAERGQAILSAAPRSMRNGWWIVARTRVIDDSIAAAIAAGCDLVLNLAAGLDTRPYRMALPEGLRWVEADLPELIAEKERLLDAERPVCDLRRYAVDLADPVARREFLDAVLAGASKALVLTEGLLVYLAPDEVAGLSASFHRPEIRWWVLDLMSQALVTVMRSRSGAMLDNAPLRFGPANGVGYFEELGWTVDSTDSLFHAAARFHRLPWFKRPFAYFPEPDPRGPGSVPWGGVVSLSR
nr:SAM-dependent methyltransferase [Nocardia jejuensis]